MRTFIRQISSYLLLLAVVYSMFVAGVAYSTNYTRKLESGVYGINFQWGSTYERSREFVEWAGKNDGAPKALIIGPSTAYRNIEPHILDSATGLNWFNLASSAQSLRNSYSLLQYALTKTKVQYVVLDVYEGAYGESYESTMDWIINSNLSFGRKYELFSNATPDVKMINQFLYRAVKSVIRHKDHMNNDPTNGSYAGKGFVCSNNDGALKSNTYPAKNCTIQPNATIFKIAELCRNNNIKLIVNIAPVLSQHTITKGWPSDYKLINNDDLAAQPGAYVMFSDSHHMTCAGANIYTHYLVNKMRPLL